MTLQDTRHRSAGPRLRRFVITVPLTGCVEVEVTADSPGAAKREGLAKARALVDSADADDSKVADWTLAAVNPSGSRQGPKVIIEESVMQAGRMIRRLIGGSK